ncbi:MAG TPA: FHA domain-containing protein [Thermoanaerobaculia bacterium]|nr:FHA domain-containing protein [Thermoanaerobaculia bacterium]
MQVILQGSLRHFRAAELLPFLCRRTEGEAVRGTLDLDSSGKRARILFENDLILWAESRDVSDPLDVLVAILEWNAGTFTVLDSAAVPEGVVPVALTLEEVFAEAKRRREEAGGYADSAIFRVVDDPALQQQISLTPDEFKILFRVAAGKTFRELLADVPVPRLDLVEKLRRLEQLGLVSVWKEDPQPVSTAPQKRTTASRKRTLVGSLTPDGVPDRVFPLLDAEHTIGRAPESGITIADGSVSSRHARILRTPQGFFVEDLQSRNGTFVNGERVVERRQLTDGDLIRVGKIILIFNLARESKTGDVTQPEVRLA